MKIELKKLKIAEHMSEETTAFTAEIYVNGKHAGYAKNDGRGGCTDYRSYDDEGRLLIRAAEKHCETLPDQKYDMGGGRDPFVMKMNLENFIDQLIEDELKKKDQKKFEKKMEKAILFGVPNGRSYAEVKFKIPLAQIPKEKLQGYVDKYKKDFKKGEKFLNTNFEKLGIKI